jgi:hypothetical protein
MRVLQNLPIKGPLSGTNWISRFKAFCFAGRESEENLYLCHVSRSNLSFASVRWDSVDFLSFFKTLDFDRSNFINLRKELDF